MKTVQSPVSLAKNENSELIISSITVNAVLCFFSLSVYMYHNTRNNLTFMSRKKVYNISFDLSRKKKNTLYRCCSFFLLSTQLKLELQVYSREIFYTLFSAKYGSDLQIVLYTFFALHFRTYLTKRLQKIISFIISVTFLLKLSKLFFFLASDLRTYQRLQVQTRNFFKHFFCHVWFRLGLCFFKLFGFTTENIRGLYIVTKQIFYTFPKQIFYTVIICAKFSSGGQIVLSFSFFALHFKTIQRLHVKADKFVYINAAISLVQICKLFQGIN